MRRILVLAAVLLLPSMAAHAVLLESDPVAGQRFDVAPLSVRIVLTEPVDPAGTDLQVHDQNGQRVDLGDLRVEPGSNPVLTVSLQELTECAYSAKWVALSTVDGHSTFGTVGFAVGTCEPPASQSGDVNNWDWQSGMARFVAFLGMALVIGGLMIPVGATLAWGKFLAFMRLGGAGLHVLGVGWLVLDSARDSALPLATFLASHVGQILQLRFLIGFGMLVLALLWMIRPVRLGPWVLALGMVVAGVQSARLGHGSQYGPATVGLDTIHMVASIAWVGALFAFSSLLSKPSQAGLSNEALHRIGLRFGTFALTAVLALAITGTIVALDILGPMLWDWKLWVGTYWGALLILKWMGLFIMLGLAANNRFDYLRSPAKAGSPGFTHLVRTEFAVGVVVLLLAGILTSVGAPAPPAEPSLKISVDGSDFYGTLTITPLPQVGAASTLRYSLQSEDGILIDPDCGRENCLRLTTGQTGEGRTTWPIVHDGQGQWIAKDVLWTNAGNHTISLTIQTATVYLDVLDAVIEIP